MTKRIAVINDLSGFGRCSLTAAISVIAAMGVQPCPLPTAILSAQTGYPSYFYDDYTDKMGSIRKEWEKMGVSFDGIYTGFLSGSRQIGKVMEFLDVFYKKNSGFLLVDPVMGDNGQRFSIFSSEFQTEMKQLVSFADIITPNLTELCLLAGIDPGAVVKRPGEKRRPEDEKQIMHTVEGLARSVMKTGPKEVIVTGIRFVDNTDGKEKMGNLIVTKDEAKLFSQPFIGESYSGTGDLFASVIAGGKARGDSLEADTELAGEMIARAMSDSVSEGIPRDEGVEYEKYLPMLQNISFLYR